MQAQSPYSTQMKLMDRYQREISYLRLAVTDRCNLRCRYCMPDNGIRFLPERELLSWGEMKRLVTILIKLGIRKVRITGGEPFMREGLVDFLKTVRSEKGLEELCITTNGYGIVPFVAALKEIGIDGINLSMDTLSRSRFFELTRRDVFNEVMAAFESIIEHGIPLKINTVAQAGLNEDELIDIAYLAQSRPVEVRFIEEMPFLSGRISGSDFLDAKRIQSMLESHFHTMIPFVQNSETAKRFRIPGFAGNIGIIAGNSRSFCRKCNRIRIAPSGHMKTCLYGGRGLSLKPLLAEKTDDGELSRTILKSVWQKEYDGFGALRNRDQETYESMARIGG